jgi:hypothetical protein
MKQIDSESNEISDEVVTEVEFLKKLKSNYIIEYVDYFREGFYHYIVTELANDGDLAISIARYKEKRKRFSIEIVILWATQLLKGICAMFVYYKVPQM